MKTHAFYEPVIMVDDAEIDLQYLQTVQVLYILYVDLRCCIYTYSMFTSSSVYNLVIDRKSNEKGPANFHETHSTVNWPSRMEKEN